MFFRNMKYFALSSVFTLMSCGSEVERETPSNALPINNVASSVPQITSSAAPLLSSVSALSSEAASQSNPVASTSSLLSVSSSGVPVMASSSSQQLGGQSSVSSVASSSTRPQVLSSSSSKRTQLSSSSSSRTASNSSFSMSSELAASSDASVSSEAIVSKTAHQIIQEQCVSCHMGWHSQWLEYDDDEWITAVAGSQKQALIDIDSPENSLFIRKISFYAADESNMPMKNPQQTAPFTKEDYDTLVSWVVEMVESKTSNSSEDVSSAVASSIAASSSDSSSTASSASVIASINSVSSSSVVSVAISSSDSSSEQTSSSETSSSENTSSENSSSLSSVAAIQSALEIIEARCVSCHDGFHDVWSGMEDNDWLNAKSYTTQPLINIDNLSSSILLARMSFYSDGSASNMPPSGSDQADLFTDQEFQVIQDWVLSLGSQEGSSEASSLTTSSESSQTAELSSGSSSSFTSLSSVSSDGGNTSSSLALSSSSLAASESSAGSSSGAADFTALEILEEQCAGCHFGSHDAWKAYKTDEDWRVAQSRSGASYIDSLDPDNSLLLRRMKYYGASNSNMPPESVSQSNPFTRAQYDVVLDWIRSFSVQPAAPEVEIGVSIVDGELTEQGLSINLECESDVDLTLALLNPESIGNASTDEYQGLISREAGLVAQSSDTFVTEIDDGTFYLMGEGADFWKTSIYFNGLRKEVVNGQLDMTLDILSVTDVNHDFAKVGLLVSDTADLSGQMVFVHWSGRKGLGEDSGLGTLSEYRQIVANPVPGSLTPSPSRLRVVYENDVLKVGGCYGCDEPSTGLPKTLNFKPKYVFVIASSHEVGGVIQAHLSLIDDYALAGRYEQIYEQPVACRGGTAAVTLFADDLSLDYSRLFVEVFSGDSLVASTSIVKTFSEVASCELQDELLEPKLRRLSQEQIQNSIVSVLGDIFDDDIWPDLEDGARLIGMNSTADKLNINNLNFERLYDMVAEISATVIADDSAVKACVAATSASCVNNWLTEYGNRLWRRPFTAAEGEALQLAVSELSNNQERMAFAIHSLLLSSNFYFRSEIGSLSNGVQQLSNYEIVSILSYALVNTTPDDELLILAAQAQPLSAAQLRSQADRLLLLPAANQAMVSVYKDYLKLDLVNSTPKSAELGFTDVVRRDVLASAELGLLNSISTNPGYMDVFLGNQFYVNKNIDYLFNVDSTSESLVLRTLDGSERQGLLNHPAFLSVHSTLSNSGIVKRGVFTLEQLLCQELPDPPDNVMPQPVPDNIDASITSERDLLQITHSAQSACFGCHQVIDPAGFGFENFDAIGRYRTSEKGNVAIDASGVLDTVGEHILMYSTSAEYSVELTRSPQMQACVSRRFLESFLGQDIEMNACEVEKYQNYITNGGGSVQDLLYSLIQLESFGKRQRIQ